jgi:hypothetical protein
MLNQTAGKQHTSFGRLSIPVDSTTILSTFSVQTMEKNKWMILPDSSESRENWIFMSRDPTELGGKIGRSIPGSTPQPTIDLMVAPMLSLRWTD